jgi:hypothetical protein
MKKFLLVVGLNFLILAVILEGLATWMLSSFNYFAAKHQWNWLSFHQKDVEKNLGSDTLVLGCSVAKQLFPFRARKNYHTTTAVDLMVTSYIYIAKAIESTPQLKTVIILTIPYGFCHRFENVYSYNIFVKPYYKFSNFRFFDVYLHQKVAQKPFALLNAFKLFKILPFSDFNYNDGKPIRYDTLPEFSVHYLKRLRDLAARHHVKLIFVASPVSERFMKYTGNLAALREDIHKYGFDSLFTGYFEHIPVYPDSCFKDEAHFKPDFLKLQREEIIKGLRLTASPATGGGV